MVFIPDSPAYRSCCCHARTCTIAIGVFEVLGLLGQLIGLVTGYATNGDQVIVQDITRANNGTDVLPYLGPSTVSLACSVVGFVLGVIVVVMLFVGIAKANHNFLVPHLISQVISMIGLAFGVTLSIVAGITAAMVASSTEDQHEVHISGMSVVAFVTLTVIIMAIVIFLEIWFFVVVLKCYRFFRDQREAKKEVVAYDGNSARAQKSSSEDRF